MNTLINNFPGTLTAMICCFIFGKMILQNKTKINIPKTIVRILIYAIILNLTYLAKYSYIRTILSPIFYYLFFINTFKMTKFETTITTIVYYIMLFTGEMIFMALMSLLLKFNYNELYITFGGSFIGNLLVCTFCLLVSLLLRKILYKLIKIKIKNYVLLYWCISLFILAIFQIICLKYGVLSYIITTLILISLIILFISFYQTNKNNELETKYDKLLEFIKKYEEEIDNQRVLRHETKNQLLIIKSKLIDKDKEASIIKYIDEIIKDNNKNIKNSEYAKLKYLPANGIKGLLYFKVSEAIDHKIKVNINISKNIENGILSNLTPNSFNQIGKILSIILDNAIEASESSKDKLMGIEIYQEDDEVTIIISNTYDNINDNLKSTKGPQRGHGLLLLKSILSRNNKLSNQREITDNLFIQKIIIKK